MFSRYLVPPSRPRCDQNGALFSCCAFFALLFRGFFVLFLLYQWHSRQNQEVPVFLLPLPGRPISGSSALSLFFLSWLSAGKSKSCPFAVGLVRMSLIVTFCRSKGIRDAIANAPSPAAFACVFFVAFGRLLSAEVACAVKARHGCLPTALSGEAFLAFRRYRRLCQHESRL